MRSSVHTLLAGTLGFASKAITGQTLEERADRHVRKAYPKDIAALQAAHAKRMHKNAKRLKDWTKRKASK